MSKDKKDDGLKKGKSAIEQGSLINEVIKRENRFHSINKVFTLNPKKRIVTLIISINLILIYFTVYIIAEKPQSIKNIYADNVSRASMIPLGN